MVRWRRARPVGRVEFDDRYSEVCDPTRRAAYQIERERSKVMKWMVGRW